MKGAAASAAAVAISPWSARAQDYPVRPIRLVVGFLPGSAADTVARIISHWLSQELRQAVIIENKAGAATNIATQAMISSPPDGYTLGLVGSSNAANATLFASLPFNFLQETAPVAGLSRLPMVLVVSPSVSAKTVAELIAYAKENPGKIDMASFGAGTISHLAGELFKSMTGVKLTHVPYRGSAPAHIDMFSGRVHMLFDTLTASMPHIRAGALRALAVTGDVRYAALPDVPILADTVPGFVADAWNGIAAPRATPVEIIERLNRAINTGLADATVKARLADVASTPFIATPAEFGAHMASETERWAKVIRAAGIKSE